MKIWQMASGSNVWYLNNANLYWMLAANSGVHDVTTEDLALWAWVKVNPGAANSYIIDKRPSTNLGYAFSMISNNLWMKIGDGTNTYTMLGNTDLRDGIWHMVAGIIDRNNAANCKLFIDGVEDGTTTKIGVLANVLSISTGSSLHIGANVSETFFFDGCMAEVGICYPADIMAADEFGGAGQQAIVYGNFRNNAVWMNREDSFPLDEGTGTTIAGENNNLTLSNALAWALGQRPS
jgi:hypothetical protein